MLQAINDIRSPLMRPFSFLLSRVNVPHSSQQSAVVAAWPRGSWVADTPDNIS